jgi:hypothetical protein
MGPVLRNAVIAAVIAAVFAGGLWWFHYIPDDTYIGLRYARNLADGEGLVFNPGERVEGYTNFLWIILLAAVAKAGIPLVPAARALSLLSSIGTLVLAWRACRHLIAEEIKLRDGTVAASGTSAGGRSIAAAAAPLMLAASAPFVTWSLSGTEIPLFTFLLTAGMMLLSTGRPARPVFAVFAALTLVRPEGAAFFALAAVLLVVRGERPRRVAAEGALVAAFLLAPYVAWKIYWFGGMLPNTFYAKTGAPIVQLRNGLDYTARFAAWHVWLPLAAVVFYRISPRVSGDGKRDGRSLFFGRIAVPLSIVILNWIIVILLGGDWMPQYRLLVPSLPAIAVMAAAAIPRATAYQVFAMQGSRQNVPNNWRWSARHAFLPALIMASLAMAPGSSGYGAFRNERLAVRAYGWVGEILGERLPGGTSLGCGSTGAVGYFSGLPIIDILGLTEPEIARNGKIVSDQPGHMKALGSHVLDRRPDLLLLGNIQIHRGKRPEDLGRIKVQERDIILDPRFSAEYEFASLPLGGGFFLSCYVRSGSAVFSE